MIQLSSNPLRHLLRRTSRLAQPRGSGKMAPRYQAAQSEVDTFQSHGKREVASIRDRVDRYPAMSARDVRLGAMAKCPVSVAGISRCNVYTPPIAAAQGSRIRGMSYRKTKTRIDQLETTASTGRWIRPFRRYKVKFNASTLT